MKNIATGQVWRDSDGLKWRVVYSGERGIFIKRHGYPNQSSMEVNAGWFKVWTLVG